MKSKALKLSIAAIVLLFAQVSKAQMAKSETKIDLKGVFQEGAEGIKESETQVKVSIERSPSSFGEPVVMQVKKKKFEDYIPTMEEFNFMQEQMEKSSGVAAH